MKTVIEMAKEAGFTQPEGETWYEAFPQCIERFAELVRADEREQIAQMFENAPPLVECAQNEHGGCMICGFTPRLATAAIRARDET